MYLIQYQGILLHVHPLDFFRNIQTYILILDWFFEKVG